MASIKSNIEGASEVPFMADFMRLNALWNGPNAPYKSEYSARWAVKKLRSELVAAKAIAYHASGMMIHPKRFADVAEQAAINEAETRLNGKSARTVDA